MPELGSFLAQLGIAAIFVVAWFRSDAARDKDRDAQQVRYDKLQAEYLAAQTQHRHEMLELIRDIVSDPYNRPKVPKIE